MNLKKSLLRRRVQEETTHEFKAGEGGFGSLPNAEGQEGEWIDLKYASVSDYFVNPHEHESMFVLLVRYKCKQAIEVHKNSDHFAKLGELKT